ncbi:folate-sensitive fragile site protein Fra10Ac1-domain-containing protein [Blastocladiella britannica]|nr:folate-sensitive fragile site protein Fra10Ac1-domain-containing protein [Blastocladiella britannica]
MASRYSGSRHYSRRPPASSSTSSLPPLPVTAAEAEAAMIRKHHRFLYQDDDESDNNLSKTSKSGTTAAEDWERRVARAYDAGLYKEYALCDLSRWREGKIALRWRTRDEVMRGAGEKTCANVAACARTDGLESYELPFQYRDPDGSAQQALVKARVCRKCARKLVAARAPPKSSSQPNECQARVDDQPRPSPEEAEASADQERERKRRKRQ